MYILKLFLHCGRKWGVGAHNERMDDIQSPDARVFPYKLFTEWILLYTHYSIVDTHFQLFTLLRFKFFDENLGLCVSLTERNQYVQYIYYMIKSSNVEFSQYNVSVKKSIIN